MKVFFTKSKLIIMFLAVSAILSGCQALRGLRSEGQPYLQSAGELWDQGRELEALVPATQALIVDPDFHQGKSFINDRFDITIEKAHNRLNHISPAQTSQHAEEIFRIYDAFVKIYDNVAKMKLPVEHHRGRWSWTTKIVDYTYQRDQAREVAFDLLMKEAREHVASHEITNAERKFSNAINNYLITQEEKDSVSLVVAGELTDFASTLEDSNVIEEAITSHAAFASALRFVKGFEKAAAGVEKMVERISTLYTEQGQELIMKTDVESWVAAIESFRNAVKWNAQNQLAQQLLNETTLRIAEYYYQAGQRAERDNNPTLAIEMYTEVRKWITDYKDSMQRIYLIRIGLKTDEINSELAQANKNYREISGLTNTVVSATHSGASVMNSIEKISEKTQSVSTALDRTSQTLRVFNVIPKVGMVTSNLARTADRANRPLKPFAEKFSRLETPVIKPGVVGMNRVKEDADKIKVTVDRTGNALNKTQKISRTLIDCIADIEDESTFVAIERQVDQILVNMRQVNSNLPNISGNLKGFETHAKRIADLSGNVRRVEKGVNDIEGVVKHIDNIINDLNRVLNQKITVLAWSFSVREVLEGLPRPVRTAMNAFSDAAGKLLDPVLDKFNVNFPEIPGLDQLSNELDRLKQNYDRIIAEMDKLKTQFQAHERNIDNLSSSISAINQTINCN